MRIGILGGHIGSTIGRLWAKAGDELRFGTRAPDDVESLTRELGPKAAAVKVADAVAFGEVVLLAIPHNAGAELAAHNGSYFATKTVTIT